MDRTNIPVGKETRRKLRIIKADKGYRSYDELLQKMIQEEERFWDN